MVQLSQTEIIELVNLKDFNLHIYSNDNPIDFFLEFDLHYPDKLYDYHNDYHLTGGKMEANKDLLSDYQLQIKEDEKFSLVRNKKRIPNLGNKIKHKPHYQNSKLYLKKIQRILEFKQEPFLKPYIEHNTDLLRGTEKEGNKIKIEDAKLSDGAAFAQSLENLMNKVDVKIVTIRKQYLTWSCRPSFK